MYTIKYYSRTNVCFRESHLNYDKRRCCKTAVNCLSLYNQSRGKEYEGFWATIHYNPGDKYMYELEQQIGYIDYDFKKGQHLIYLYDIYGEIEEGKTWDEV